MSTVRLAAWAVLGAGAVALIVGVVGLFAPVSVGADAVNVRCGNAVSPDLSAAREKTELGGRNVPPPSSDVDPGYPTDSGNNAVVNTDFIRLCDKELEDRRQWTITLAAVGGLAVVGALTARVMAARVGARRDP